MEPITLLEVLVGSRAYGTAGAESDTDKRIVFAHYTRDLLSVDSRGNCPLKHDIWNEKQAKGDDEDLTGWEVGKFIKLALNCNPTILEVLWAPDYVPPHYMGTKLRRIRGAFLSRDRIYNAFRGYASNQAKKMFFEPGAGVWTIRNWKFAEAYIRALYQGVELLKAGELPVKMPDVLVADTLLHVKRGEVSKSGVVSIADRLEQELHAAYSHSEVSAEPDLVKINDFLIELRKAMW